MARLLLLLLLLPCAVSAQSTWTWLPSGKVVPDLLADPLEPRNAVMKEIGRDRIEARVGSMWDVLRWEGARPVLGFERASFGLGGAAIMQLRWRLYGEKSRLSFPWGFDQLVAFPLETGDYYFGGYVAGEQRYGEVTARLRFHVVHVSAHLGDGRYDNSTGMWADDRPPIYYSRNYLQTLVDVSVPGGFRAYLAPSIISFQSDLGRELSPFFMQFGAEYRGQGSFLAKPFLATDFRTSDVPDGAAGPMSLSAAAGVRIGPWDGRGVELRLERTSGPSWRGQFYGLSEQAWSIGFALDFAE